MRWCFLFECLINSPYEDIKIDSVTIIGKTFTSLYEAQTKEVQGIEAHFENFQDLKVAPLKEFKNKLSNQEINGNLRRRRKKSTAVRSPVQVADSWLMEQKSTTWSCM